MIFIIARHTGFALDLGWCNLSLERAVHQNTGNTVQADADNPAAQPSPAYRAFIQNSHGAPPCNKNRSDFGILVSGSRAGNGIRGSRAASSHNPSNTSFRIVRKKKKYPEPAAV